MSGKNCDFRSYRPLRITQNNSQ